MCPFSVALPMKTLLNCPLLERRLGCMARLRDVSREGAGSRLQSQVSGGSAATWLVSLRTAAGNAAEVPAHSLDLRRRVLGRAGLQEHLALSGCWLLCAGQWHGFRALGHLTKSLSHRHRKGPRASAESRPRFLSRQEIHGDLRASQVQGLIWCRCH